MSRPCECEGSNENCRFCYGLGTVQDKSTLKRARVKYVPPNREFGQDKPKLSNSFVFIPDTEPNRTPIRKTSQRNANRKLYKSCPICKATIRISFMATHIRGVHNNSALLSSTVDGAHHSSAQPPDEVIRRDQRTVTKVRERIIEPKLDPSYGSCPICKVRVRTDRVQKHVAKVHKRPPAGPSNVGSHLSEDPRRKSATHVSPREKNLDVTKPYAHSYRERGHYGSYPSHDGFDDESGPD